MCSSDLESYEAARRLQSARQAFDISGEREKNRELYGDSAFGRRCLLARKLVESGVAFIEVGQSSYDSHADNFGWHKGLVPPMEHAWAGLLVDLQQRGLLDKTLVIWAGEIGRTPKINGTAGRDHWPKVFSVALAGGGVKRGHVHGSSDGTGGEPDSDPVGVEDYAATIFHQIGIDPARQIMTPGGRPQYIVKDGKVVRELLA